MKHKYTVDIYMEAQLSLNFLTLYEKWIKLCIINTELSDLSLLPEDACVNMSGITFSKCSVIRTRKTHAQTSFW